MEPKPGARMFATCAMCACIAVACSSKPRPVKAKAEAAAGCPEQTIEAPVFAPRFQVQEQHLATVTAVAFSSDGRLLASAAQDGSVRIWDVSTRGLLRVTRRVDLPNPQDLAFEPGTARVAIASSDGTILYDVESEAVTRFEGEHRDDAAAFDIEATGRDDDIRWVTSHSSPPVLYSGSGGRLKALKAPPDFDKLWSLRDLAVSADGRWVAVAARDTGVVIWDLDDTDAPGRVIAIDGSTDQVAFAGESSALFAWVRPAPGGDTAEARLVAIDAAADSPAVADVYTPGSWAGGVPVVGSRERVALVTGDVHMFEAGSGQRSWSREARTTSLRGEITPGARYQVAAFSPDGGAVAVGTFGGGLELFDAGSGRDQGSFGVPVRRPVRLSFAGEHELVAQSATDVTVWSLEDGSAVRQIPMQYMVAAQGADQSSELRVGVGRYHPSCASGDQSFFFGSAKGLTAPEPEALYAKPTCLRAVRFADLDLVSRRAVSVTYERAAGSALVVDDLGAGTRVALKDSGAASTHSGTRFATDGDRVVGGGIPMMGFLLAEELPVWDAKTGDELAALSIRYQEGAVQVTGGSFGDVDGDRAVVVAKNIISFRSFPDNGELETRALDSWISFVRFVPGSGGEVLVGTYSGKLLRISPNKTVAESDNPGAAIQSPAISTRRNRIAAVGLDGAIRVWRLSDLTLLGTLVSFDDDEYVAVSPSGYYAGTAEVADRIGWVFEAPLERFGFDQFVAFSDPAAVRRDLSGSQTPAAPSMRRPPAARIDGPVTVDADGRAARLVVKASSTARVDSIQAYVEGRPVASTLVCAPSGKVELTVPLYGGLNTVTVAAFDDRGMASNPATATAIGQASGKRPTLWIVAVGVSGYPNLAPEFQLRYADDDARDMAAAFGDLAGEGKPYERLRSIVLTDAKATVETIGSALGALRSMEPDDVAVVMLAGHGIKPDGGQMVFLTRNASLSKTSLSRDAISWDDIGERLAAAKGRVVLLLDACHAGDITRDHVVRNQDLAASLVRTRRAGVVVFSAAKGRQQSYEPAGSRGLEMAPPERELVGDDRGNGLFSGAILQSLSASATDRNGDGAIQLSELIEDVTRRVTWSSSGLQTPWVARREMFGDFTIAPAP